MCQETARLILRLSADWELAKESAKFASLMQQCSEAYATVMGEHMNGQANFRDTLAAGGSVQVSPHFGLLSGNGNSRPSMNTAPHNERLLPSLPRPLTSFIGRDRETASLAAIVRDGARLITLTGPGGVGKTRLAIHAARPLASDFPDGVAFVPLAAVADPRQMAPSIALAFGFRGESDSEALSHLVGELRNRRALLILDNLEQIREAAPAIAELLQSCPWLHVLATSRVRLRLSGENVFGVPPLNVHEWRGNEAASREVDTPQLMDGTHSEAVQLFVDRAKAVNQSFVLTADQANVVSEICHRLDGLPLAIELAAARVGVLPPGALLTRLRQRLPLLTDGPCDAPNRQQTVWNTINWSHEILGPGEQVLFRRLGVIVGDWTLEAAETVANLDSDLDVLGHLAALIDANLVRLIEGQAQPRYGMLETIREFAAERLVASPDERRVREAYARYMLNLASRAWWAFPERHYVRDGQEWLNHALAQSETTSDEARSLALASAALAAFNTGDFTTAEQLAEASIELASVGGHDLQMGVALYVLLLVYQERGDFPRSVAFGEESIRHFRQAGDKHWLSEGLVITWFSALLNGDRQRADQLQEEGFALCLEVGNVLGLALARNDQGAEAQARGDLQAALTGYREALELKLTIDEHVYIAHPLAGIASILDPSSHAELAARLLGVVAQIHDKHGTFAWILEQERDKLTMTKLRAILGEERYADAFSAGRVLPIATAARLALAATADRSCLLPCDEDPALQLSKNEVRDAVQASRARLARVGFAGTVSYPASLTPREQEILQLLGQRLSDAEIADELYIGVRTVEFHVSNILSKLGATNRREAALIISQTR